MPVRIMIAEDQTIVRQLAQAATGDEALGAGNRAEAVQLAQRKGWL
jgi:hypothetical protein